MFTALGNFATYKALSLGSAEITQLIINTKILSQMIEELIIFGVYPNFIAAIGMLGAGLGVTTMIFTKERQNLRYDYAKDDNFYVDVDSYEKENEKK